MNKILRKHKEFLAYFLLNTENFSSRSTNDVSGSWWRSGCRKVEGNDSHTTCECNHLTNFVILSSNSEIPLLGAIQDEVEGEKSSQDFLEYINIVRGGVIVSIILLLVVIGIFFFSRCMLKLNFFLCLS